MNKISATIVADSVNQQGDRLTSLQITFPRILLSEINTHRMLSKNTSSSRAIPFLKMVEAVQNNPFIPFAWQKYHPGMQGSEYLDETVKYDLISFMTILNDTLSNTEDEKERARLSKRIEEKTKIIKELLTPYTLLEKTLPEWWLFARDKAVETASILYVFDVTKQLCNRLLEPFMWTTMLITGSKEGWDNFFELRNPVYEWEYEEGVIKAKSKEEFLEMFIKRYPTNGEIELHDWEAVDENFDPVDSNFWRSINKGQAEIHMMALAESIYDAVNESTPKQLQAGEWHIPFEDKIHKVDTSIFSKPEFVNPVFDMIRVKISTAMAARTSYTVVGEEKEINYEKMIELHDRLLAQNPPHSSPMEHACQAVTDEEYNNSFKGQEKGWFRNYKGFKSYRQVIEESK